MFTHMHQPWKSGLLPRKSFISPCSPLIAEIDDRTSAPASGARLGLVNSPENGSDRSPIENCSALPARERADVGGVAESSGAGLPGGEARETCAGESDAMAAARWRAACTHARWRHSSRYMAAVMHLSRSWTLCVEDLRMYSQTNMSQLACMPRLRYMRV